MTLNKPARVASGRIYRFNRGNYRDEADGDVNVTQRVLLQQVSSLTETKTDTGKAKAQFACHEVSTLLRGARSK